MPRKPQSKIPELPDDVVDRVVLLLVSLRSRADVRRACLEHEKLRLTADQADAAIAAAHARVTLAAACDYDHELGAAKTRLIALFQKANAAADFKTALGVQKELSKLQGLYPRKNPADPTAADAPDDSPALEQLAAARAHLVALLPADEDEPLDELARRVVALFTSK